MRVGEKEIRLIEKMEFSWRTLYIKGLLLGKEWRCSVTLGRKAKAGHVSYFSSC
jgi:hypothetical protein